MKICLTDWISWQEYKKKIYVFNEKTKRTYIFFDSARFFWLAIVNDCNIDTIVAQLCSKYNNEDAQMIYNDFLEYLTELRTYGLIQMV